MINLEELREYIIKVIKEELTVNVEHTSETDYDHAKIRVSLQLGSYYSGIEEFSYSEDRIYTKN